jgi:hypothetical protein
MDHAEKRYWPWHSAPVGALVKVQGSADDPAITGIVCEEHVDKKPWLLVLECTLHHAAVGHLLSAEIGSMEGTDVSSEYDVIWGVEMPLRSPSLEVGEAFSFEPDGAVAIKAKRIETSTEKPECYIRLDGPSRGHTLVAQMIRRYIGAVSLEVKSD